LGNLHTYAFLGLLLLVFAWKKKTHFLVVVERKTPLPSKIVLAPNDQE
jgi:hypothetical protein